MSIQDGEDMRTRARIDANQPEIVKALRALPGVTVQSLAAVGKGVPDLVVGVAGVNLLLEIKDGGKVPSARKLTSDEQAWHDGWRGQVQTVESVADAVWLVEDVREAVAERAAKRWADGLNRPDDGAAEETAETHGATLLK